MKTFSYLHVSDVSLIVSKVCRRWNELSADIFLWSQLVFIVEEKTSLRSVLSLLPHLPHLRFITIRWRTDTEDIMTFYLRNASIWKRYIYSVVVM